MDYEGGAVVAMRSPARWLRRVRVGRGAWVVNALFTKLSVTLLWGFLPVPTASQRWIHVLPILLQKYADGNPVEFFKAFLLNTVIPHSQLFAQLTAFGETAVGLGLVLGCLTTLASAI